MCEKMLIRDSMQVELTLVKQDTRSWNALEETNVDFAQLTFGVGGRTGTTGAKTPLLDATNQLAAASS